MYVTSNPLDCDVRCSKQTNKMKNKKIPSCAIRIISFLFFALFFGVVQAQTVSGLGGKRDNLPDINIRVNSGFTTGGDYEIKGNENIVCEGEMSHAYATSLDVTVPVMKIKKGTLSLGGHYNYVHQEYTPRVSAFGESVRFNDNHHTWGANVSYNFRSTLWNRALIGYARFGAECSQYGVERFSGFAAAMMFIKRTETSSFSAGAVLLLNSVSRWPLFPFVTYWRKFNDKWELNVFMPQCHVQYNVSKKSKLKFGSTIGGEHYYIRPKHSALPSTCMYSRSFVRPELVFEHWLSPLMRCSVRCGAVVYMNGRFVSDSGSRRYAELEHDPAPFVQLSFAYGLPVF